MRRLEKRQMFIPILVSFLVCGLTCYGLSSTTTKPTQGESLSSTLSERILLPDGESCPVSLPLLQVNESNGVLAQIVAGTSLYRVLTKNPGNVRSALCFRHNADSSHAETSFHIVDSINTIFKLTNYKACQYLDIPPPHVSASL